MGKPWEIIVGDVRRVLREMEAESFDATFSDLPYGIGMSGTGAVKWDYDLPSVNVFVELLRVLRPGAYAMFFGGTRTFHRMVCNVEDAGFLPCDLAVWMYGSGFPKSHDISKAIDKKAGAKRRVVGYKDSGLDKGSGLSAVNFAGSKGRAANGLVPVTESMTSDVRRWSGYGTALKPAVEPISLCCKPYKGTIADCALEHGVGGLAIDASRIGSDEPFITPAGNDETTPNSLAPTNVTGYTGKTVHGRWPANVVLQHAPGCVQRGTRSVKGSVPTGPPWTGPSTSHARGKMNGGFIESRGTGMETVEAWECVDDCPISLLDAQSGNRPGMSGGGKHRPDYAGGMFGGIDSVGTARGDQGGASRFFYSSKVSREERDRGLEDFETVAKGVGALRDGPRQGTAKNGHATLKPIDLCRYFARMLLPPPRKDGKPRRLILPYSGAGSEMIGALQAGWDEVVGIELVPKHAEWARARIAKGQIIRNAKR
jgi:site-specific DNA-methyltransferase (adenine-specific)